MAFPTRVAFGPHGLKILGARPLLTLPDLQPVTVAVDGADVDAPSEVWRESSGSEHNPPNVAFARADQRSWEDGGSTMVPKRPYPYHEVRADLA